MEQKTENPFKDLPQLDRIEYLQKKSLIDEEYFISLFYLGIGILILVTLKEIFSFTLCFIISLVFLFNWFKNSKKLKKEYFKVVKR